MEVGNLLKVICNNCDRKIYNPAFRNKRFYDWAKIKGCHFTDS